jgi:hypothetical protein
MGSAIFNTDTGVSRAAFFFLFIIGYSSQLLMCSALTKSNLCYLFQLPHWLSSNKFWIEFMSYSHAMLNPIIYAIFNTNFRHCFLNLLLCNEKDLNRDMERNCKHFLSIDI